MAIKKYFFSEIFAGEVNELIRVDRKECWLEQHFQHVH